MTASEASLVGLAKQASKGTPNVTHGDFEYLLFTDGGISPQNVIVPLDMEVGGGAMQRAMIKAGVTSAGAFSIIPRPSILGKFLLGALGEAAAPVQQGATTAYKHSFTMATDQFSAPYWTVRSSPGGLWGEQFQDMRVAALALAWRAADYVRGQVAFSGGLPTPNVATGSWAASSKIDGGPQFIAPVSTVELPTATAIKVLSGSVAMAMNIPLEEQWITGSYQPDDFDITQRSFAINLLVKITSEVLYNKMMYDPANGAAWLTDIFREGDFLLKFESDIEAGAAYPYSLQIKGNGESGATANVVWAAQPVALRAGRQVTMAVSGTFLADPSGLIEPITVELINKKTTQY